MLRRRNWRFDPLCAFALKGDRALPMKNPPHPGGFVLRQCIEPLGLTVTQAADALGVTRTTLPELVSEKGGVPPGSSTGITLNERETVRTSMASNPDLRNYGIAHCELRQDPAAVWRILAGSPGKHHEHATDASRTNAAISTGALHAGACG